MKRLVGGLDIGTTGCKLVLFDEKGEMAGSAYREYAVSRSGGLHEIDFAEVREAVYAVIAELASPALAAIGVSSFGESFVMLDESDAPLAPSMLYTDPRGREEAAELSAAFGSSRLAEMTGTMPHEMYSISKLLYLKKHFPEAVSRADKILLMQDYIVYLLSGVRQIDESLAARTGAFDIRKKEYIGELLSYVGISPSLLSRPVPSGTAAGKILPDVARQLGLDAATVIVTGCQDQIAALIGAGVTAPGEAMDGIGTVECVPVVLASPPDDPALYADGYSVVPHIGGRYACYALSYAGGATIKWFRDSFGGASYAELDREAGDAPSELLVLPHFAGAGTPYMDLSSRGAIVGLTFEHKRGELYRAMLEGTSFEIALNLRRLKRAGLSLSRVKATGGGARSSLWLSIKADIFGIPVISLSGEEIGAAGTAMLAGRAIGIYGGDFSLIREKQVYEPNPDRVGFYQKQYQKYEKLYRAIKEVVAE